MNALKPRKAFIQDELNIQRLTPIQWDGIIRAMDKYAKHYYETMQANEFEKPQEQCTLPVVINCKATTHELKTWIPYYKAVVGGVKQFEVRKDDRNFKEGDILHLREWDNTLKEYTGRDTKIGIRYILKGGAFGVQKGYVIMGLCCL